MPKGQRKRLVGGLITPSWRAMHQPVNPMRLLDLRSGWRRNIIARANTSRRPRRLLTPRSPEVASGDRLFLETVMTDPDKPHLTALEGGQNSPAVVAAELRLMAAGDDRYGDLADAPRWVKAVWVAAADIIEQSQSKLTDI